MGSEHRSRKWPTTESLAVTPRRLFSLVAEVATIVIAIAYSHVGGPPTRGAMVAVDDGEGRVLLVKARYRKNWSFPGGWVHPSESFADGGARELAEETGVTVEGPLTKIAEFRSKTHHDELFGGRAASATVTATTPWEIEATKWFAADALPPLTVSAQRIIDATNWPPPDQNRTS